MSADFFPCALENVDFVARGHTTEKSKVRPLHGDKHKHFWFLLTHQSAILYYKLSRKVIFVLPEALRFFDLLQTENGSFWLYGIAKNGVIGYDISDMVKTARRHRKKRITTADGDANLSSSKKVRTETSASQGNRQSNDVIFNGLLGVARTGDPNQSGGIDKPVGETVHLTDGDRLVLYRGDELTDCLLLDGVLVTSTACPGGCIVSFHSLKLFDDRTVPPSESCISDSGAFSSHYLQGAETESGQSIRHAGGIHGNSRNITSSREMGSLVTPCLCGAMLSMAPQGVSLTNVARGYLNPQSFRCIFGPDVTSLGSRVVILGTSVGKILWVPLKSATWDHGTDFASSTSQNTRVLYDLQEPVVSVASITLNAGNQERTEGDNSLLFIGQRGKLVIVQFGQEEGESGPQIRTRFEEKLVRGPVMSPVRIGDSCLAYSTRKELLVVKIEWVDRQDGKTKRGDLRLEETRYPVKDVTSLAKVPVGMAGSEPKLIICSSRGRVMSLNISESAQTQDPVAITTFQCGQRMKELMLSIQDVSTKTGTMHQTIKEQNSHLSELTKAGHLARLLSEAASPSSTPDCVSPFSVQSHLSHIDNGLVRTQVLKGIVTNRTEWTFSIGWSICVYVYNSSHTVDNCDIPGQGPYRLPKPVISVVHQLESWKPDSFTVLNFSLDDAKLSTSSPIQVEFYLHFLPSSSSMFVQSDFLTVSAGSHGNSRGYIGVMFPIGSKRVDILSFLQPIGRAPDLADPSDSGTKGGHSPAVPMETHLQKDRDWLANTLQEIASQHHRLHTEGVRTEERFQDLLNTSGLVLTEETRDKLKLEGRSILELLFEDNPAVTSFLQSQPSTDSLHALSSNGTKVHFILSELDNSEVKVQVNTTSPKLFAEVWEAAHFKLSGSLLSEGSFEAIYSSADRVKLLSAIKVIERKLGHLAEEPIREIQRGDLQGIYADMRKLNLKI